MFCAGYDLFGRAIEAYTHSKWSHVGIFVKLENRLCVYESREPNGVRLVQADFYSTYNGEVWAASVNGYDDATMRDTLISMMFSRLGSPYDLSEINKLIWRETVNDTDKHRFICSVLAYESFKDLSLPLADHDLVSPEQVAESPLLYDWRQLK
jgi:hypothetical protein